MVLNCVYELITIFSFDRVAFPFAKQQYFTLGIVDI